MLSDTLKSKLLNQVIAYNNFIGTKKRVTINAKVVIIKTYYSLLKSNLAVQVFTVIYVEYFVNSYEIILGGAFCSKKWRLYILQLP